MGYLIKINKEKSELIRSQTFDKEDELQEIVKKFPEIIPLNEIDEDFRPLLIIGREFSLGNAGSIDLLGIDITGLITLIEFKLEKNTDIRRVVAQTIEYAANLWEMSYDVLDRKVQEYLKSNKCEITELKNKTLVQAVEWHYRKTKKEEDEAFSSEEFIKTVSSNLQEGEFRLIIFCDSVDERTIRSVEYLNELSNFDIYCISTDEFEVDGKRFFKSNLITKNRKGVTGRKKHAGRISFDDFLNSVPTELVDVYRYFNERMKEVNGYYSMGTKGFSTYFLLNEKKIRLFEGYPDRISLLSKNYFDNYINKEKCLSPKM
jgi:hypothetical protein